MSHPSPHIDHYLAEFARIERHLAGDNALNAQRKTSLRAFADAGFPSTRQEDWKYTDLRALEKRRFESLESPGELTQSELETHLPKDLDALRLVFLDGHFQPGLSSDTSALEGIEISSLGAQSGAAGSLSPEAVDRTINGYANPFTDMNTAFMSDGLRLKMAAGAVLEKPLHVVFAASGRFEDSMQQIRNLLTLGENSQATVIEHYIALEDAPYFTNAVTEATTEPGARLTRIRLQQESENAYHVSSFHAYQLRDSHVVNHGVDFGARLARIDTNSKLDDTGATIEMYGVYAPGENQHVDNHTRIDHAKPHGTSREDYKGVLTGKSRGVFNGKIIVHKDAQKTDSEQSSATLLLSKKCEIDAKPELEIYADDVKCTHGSTVGQLDEDAVFYLTSRGISEAGARAILTYSFADALIQKIQSAALCRHIETALLAKLPDGENYSDLL